MAAARVTPGPAGTFFAMASTSGRGTARTRPTSRSTARAAMVPKVMIWLTFSGPPYFPFTYRITSSRPSRQKSMSMSGMDTRSEFRKRSKRSP